MNTIVSAADLRRTAQQRSDAWADKVLSTLTTHIDAASRGGHGALRFVMDTPAIAGGLERVLKSLDAQGFVVSNVAGEGESPILVIRWDETAASVVMGTVALSDPPGIGNLYEMLSTSAVAVALERTQINKFHTKGGTGFAAEEANAFADILAGRKVEQVGADNSLNGPDRIVDGVRIQTKYFATARETVGSAFGADGYRYDGQLLEVPSDQYEDAIELMRKRISSGQVPGISDPAEAERIIKKGSTTYRQARNIARAGNIDSLTYDMKTQSIASSYAFAISFSINFARQKWDGRTNMEALNGALTMALESGATSFVSGIATAQILRTKAAAIGVVAARDGVKFVSQSALGRSAIQKVAQVSLGKAVYGAAAVNHVAKLLRTNAVTGAVTTAVISGPDFYRAAFSRNISWAQFGKNLAVNGASVAGGAGGWMAGAAGGAAVGSVVPVIGTAAGGVIGGILGALAGGTASSVASKYLLDGLVEDDAKEMLRLLPGYVEAVANDYLLSESETNALVEIIKSRLNAAFLRDMYASKDKARFVYQAFEPDCEKMAKARPTITLPKETVVQASLDEIEEEVLNQVE
ncbi:hypothetical protein [Stenotrophomonas geniculata]|uniref:hypothetical protein n=1 Tax=Stenotrophomonas geniculata TaxID=86188 RepID=UPI0039C61325